MPIRQVDATQHTPRREEVVLHWDSTTRRLQSDDGDPYTLAVSMAELVLRDIGWQASSLGHMLPFQTIESAVKRHRPRLLWLSVTTIRDESRFTKEMHSLFDVAKSFDTAVVLGGRALHSELRRHLRYSTYCDTFQHLSDFATMLAGRDQAAQDS